MIPFLAAALAAGSDLPPAPERPVPEVDRDEAPVPDAMPAFGTDVAMGLLGGSFFGPWPEPGPHGVVLVRYDAFAVPRAASGPRLGASFWGATTAWPLPEAAELTASALGDEVERVFSFRYVQYGVMAVIRYDPAADLGADAGIGFGRLDLADYWDGPLALPMLTFEAGVRQRLRDRAFADWLLRASWATERSGSVAGAEEEWWLVQAGLALGAHVR